MLTPHSSPWYVICEVSELEKTLKIIQPTYFADKDLAFQRGWVTKPKVKQGVKSWAEGRESQSLLTSHAVNKAAEVLSGFRRSKRLGPHLFLVYLLRTVQGCLGIWRLRLSWLSHRLLELFASQLPSLTSTPHSFSILFSLLLFVFGAKTQELFFLSSYSSCPSSQLPNSPSSTISLFPLYQVLPLLHYYISLSHIYLSRLLAALS